MHRKPLICKSAADVRRLPIFDSNVDTALVKTRQMSTLNLLSATIVVLNPFYFPIKSLTLGMKSASKHQDLKMSCVKLIYQLVEYVLSRHVNSSKG